MPAVEGRHAEQFPRPLAIARRHDRRVHVYEIAFLEKLVNCVGHAAPHAEDRAEEIGAGTEMRDGPEELHAVPLFLQWVVGLGGPDQIDFPGVNFPGLAFPFRFHQPAFHRNRCPCLNVGQVLRAGYSHVDDNLEVRHATSVIEGKKGKLLRIPASSHPPLDSDGVHGGGGFQKGRNRGGFSHASTLGREKTISTAILTQLPRASATLSSRACARSSSTSSMMISMA